MKINHIINKKKFVKGSICIIGISIILAILIISGYCWSIDIPPYNSKWHLSVRLIRETSSAVIAAVIVVFGLFKLFNLIEWAWSE